MSDISRKTKASRTSIYNCKNDFVSAELEDTTNDIKSNKSNETDGFK